MRNIHPLGHPHPPQGHPAESRRLFLITPPLTLKKLGSMEATKQELIKIKVIHRDFWPAGYRVTVRASHCYSAGDGTAVGDEASTISTTA